MQGASYLLLKRILFEEAIDSIAVVEDLALLRDWSVQMRWHAVWQRQANIR